MRIQAAAFVILFTLLGVSNAAGQEKRKQLPMEHMAGLLGLVETIPLPTDGWMDHMAVDLKNQHLFISDEFAQLSGAAVGGTVAVRGLRKSAQLPSLPGT